MEGGYHYERRPAPPPPPAPQQYEWGQWFLDGEGIEHRVVQSDIPRYLGNNATVKRGYGPDGRPGYWYSAYRLLTDAMITSLKNDSQRYLDEKKYPYQQEIEYVHSRTFRDSQHRQRQQEMVERRQLEQRQERQDQQQQRQPPAHEMAVPQIAPRPVDQPQPNPGPPYVQQLVYPSNTAVYPQDPSSSYGSHPQPRYQSQANTYNTASRYSEYDLPSRGGGGGGGSGRGGGDSYYRATTSQPHYDYAHVPPGARGDVYTREGPPAQPRYQPAPGGEGYVASDPAPPEESTPSEDHPPPSGREGSYFIPGQPQYPRFRDT